MRISAWCSFSSTGSPFDVAFLNEKWFVNFFDRFSFFTYSGSNCSETNGPPLNFSMMVRRILLSISSSPF